MATAPTVNFAIERGIAMPNRNLPASSYPFKEMEVGDSFAVSYKKKDSVGVCAARYGKPRGIKFTVRKHGDAYRCWRVL